MQELKFHSLKGLYGMEKIYNKQLDGFSYLIKINVEQLFL
jgi:hypothetical protein